MIRCGPFGKGTVSPSLAGTRGSQHPSEPSSLLDAHRDGTRVGVGHSQCPQHSAFPP